MGRSFAVIAMCVALLGCGRAVRQEAPPSAPATASPAPATQTPALTPDADGTVALEDWAATRRPQPERIEERAPAIPKVEAGKAGRLRCGALAGLRVAPEATPLLGGHLTVRAPKQAASDPLPWDVMSAPQTDEEETRLMVQHDGDTLVILARETWQTAPEDLATAAKGWFDHSGRLERVGYELVELASTGTRVFAARPKSIVLEGDAALVLATMVVHPDRTVQAVEYFVSASVFGKQAGCTAWAERLAVTVAEGPRQLRTAAGPREMFVFLDGQQAVVDVPAGYVLTTQSGGDFMVHRFHKLAPLGRMPGALTLGVGFHMDRTLPGCDDECDTKLRHRSQILGRTVDWQGGANGTWAQVGQFIELDVAKRAVPVDEEAALVLDDEAVTLVLHAWSSVDPRFLLEAVRITESMRLRPS